MAALSDDEDLPEKKRSPDAGADGELAQVEERRLSETDLAGLGVYPATAGVSLFLAGYLVTRGYLLLAGLVAATAVTSLVAAVVAYRVMTGQPPDPPPNPPKRHRGRGGW